MASGATDTATPFFTPDLMGLSPHFLESGEGESPNLGPGIYPIARCTDFACRRASRSSHILSGRQIRPAETNLLSEEESMGGLYEKICAAIISYRKVVTV